jgi:hypothetical protein
MLQVCLWTRSWAEIDSTDNEIQVIRAWYLIPHLMKLKTLNITNQMVPSYCYMCKPLDVLLRGGRSGSHLPGEKRRPTPKLTQDQRLLPFLSKIHLCCNRRSLLNDRNCVPKHLPWGCRGLPYRVSQMLLARITKKRTTKVFKLLRLIKI